MEEYIKISDDGSNWKLEILENINSDNWFDNYYPDPESGYVEIVLEYVCDAGADNETVTCTFSSKKEIILF